MRGTYAALAHPAVVEHLVKLGVTAIELMPIHAFADDQFLVEKGLKNYWGYSTLAFFAPEPRYYGPDADGVLDLKAAVRTLHEANIEVILDVVYNHTAEGNHLGPTLSFRGIDNRSYYKLSPENPRFVWDVTGTGNTLDLAHPRVLQMVTDSLRHWVEAYHIDGFRFDLAPALARDPFEFSDRAGFLRVLGQDPVLSRVKLIAEPWDVGENGYRLGQFPPGWSEWNDASRDTMRAFWRGDPGNVSGIARALTGSREIFQTRGRQPWASVQYVCSHDGFTLEDVVSYNERHNETNKEDNKDGHPHNLSWNCGVEGATRRSRNSGAAGSAEAEPARNGVLLGRRTDAADGRRVLAHTERATTTPIARTMKRVGWIGSVASGSTPICWRSCSCSSACAVVMMSFAAAGISPVRRSAKSNLKDVYWLAPEGREMTNEDWGEEDRRTLGMQIGNDSADGQRFIVLLNARHERVDFRLDPDLPGAAWTHVFDTQRSARPGARASCRISYKVEHFPSPHVRSRSSNSPRHNK